MSTDLPEGGDPQRGGGGRPPRVGDSRSPVGSTLSIVLAVVAVVAGFLILRELTDDDGGSTATGNGSEESAPLLTLAPGNSAPATDGRGAAVTSTTAAAVRSGATIAVANASGVAGSAGAMSAALETEGYKGVGEPGNSEQRLETSVVYYVATDPAAEAVASRATRARCRKARSSEDSSTMSISMQNRQRTTDISSNKFQLTKEIRNLDRGILVRVRAVRGVLTD